MVESKEETKMPVFHVLLDASSKIVGHARTDVASAGAGAPASATPVAGTGQRIAEVTVDEKTAALGGNELYAALKKLVK